MTKNKIGRIFLFSLYVILIIIGGLAAILGILMTWFGGNRTVLTDVVGYILLIGGPIFLLIGIFLFYYLRRIIIKERVTGIPYKGQ